MQSPDTDPTALGVPLWEGPELQQLRPCTADPLPSQGGGLHRGCQGSHSPGPSGEGTNLLHNRSLYERAFTVCKSEATTVPRKRAGSRASEGPPQSTSHKPEALRTADHNGGRLRAGKERPPHRDAPDGWGLSSVHMAAVA